MKTVRKPQNKVDGEFKKQTAFAQFQRMIDDVKKKIKTKESELKSLDDQFEKKKLEHEQKIEAYKKVLASLEEQVNEWNEKWEDIIKKKNDIDLKFSNAEDNLKKKNADYDFSLAELVDLKEEVRKARQQKKDAEKELAKEKAKKNQTIKELNQEIIELEDEVGKLNSSRRDKKTEVDQLTIDSNNLNEDIEKKQLFLGSEISEHFGLIEKMKKDLEKREKEVKNSEFKLQEREKEFDKKFEKSNEALDQKSKDVDEKLTTLKEKEKKVEHAENRIADLKHNALVELANFAKTKKIKIQKDLINELIDGSN